MFHSTSDSPPSLHDDLDNTYCAVAAFQHADPDLARDPLSTNRCLHDTSDLEMFGTLVVASPTPDQIFVLIPDSVGPIVDAESPVDIQHVVGLSLGSATDHRPYQTSSTLPSNSSTCCGSGGGHSSGGVIISTDYLLHLTMAL